MRTFVEWLKRHKFTTEEFAHEAGVSVCTAYKWRQGSRPRTFTRRTLARRYADCPIFK